MASLRRCLLVILTCVACGWSLPAWAKAAVTLPVQGVLRTTAGGAVADGVYVVTVTIYDQASGGAALWKDTYNAAVQGGLFAFEIGGGASPPLPTQLTASAAPLWFGIKVGADPELPLTAIGWVPRALWANAAGTAEGLNCTGCISADQILGGTITADKIGFNYAGSDSAGGPATSALTATKADSATTATSAQTAVSADSAKSALTAATADSATFATSAGNAATANSATTAGSASTAASADVAKNVTCTACIALSELANDAVKAFLSTSGGTVTGDVTINGNATITNLLNVNGGLNLGNGVIIGGLLTSGPACDAAHNGAFSWDATAHRFALCNGSAYQKLAYCSEQCLSADKVACGATIPDICGDACVGKNAGTGTLCSNTGEQCLNNACSAVPKSCLAIHQADSNNSKPTGVYQIDPDGPGGNAPFSAYCDMSSDDGGWTLVMKMNGASTTFNYDSSQWTTAAAYNPTGYAWDQSNEHKSAAYGTLGFSAMRVTMLFAGSYQTVAFPQGASSLLALFGSDTYQPTYFGRSAWQGLIQNGSLLPACNREGINARPYSNPSSPATVYADAYNTGVLRARFGILTNQAVEGDCKTPDAVIGFGIAGQACGSNTTGSAGNFAFCGASPNNSYTANAWAYLFIR